MLEPTHGCTAVTPSFYNVTAPVHRERPVKPTGTERAASACPIDGVTVDVRKASRDAAREARAALVARVRNSSVGIVPADVFGETAASGPRAPSPSTCPDGASGSPFELDAQRGSSPRSVAPGAPAALPADTDAAPSLAGAIAAGPPKLQRQTTSRAAADAATQAAARRSQLPLPLSPPPLAVVAVAGPTAREEPPPPRAVVGSAGQAARCLVLDNDETTGYYQLLSLLYSIYVHLTGAPPPRAVVLAQLAAGAARPGTIELLQLAHRLQQQGRLDHVVVWTAASDATGWVRFLVGCLEEFAGVPTGTVGVVLCREDVLAAGVPGQVIKDLRRVCSDARHVVLVDDKPQFVRHGTCLAVAPYEQHVPIGPWVEAMAGAVSAEGLQLARDALRDDAAANKPPSERDFSNDRALLNLLGPIEELFP
jgi:hypothetical protein